MELILYLVIISLVEGFMFHKLFIKANESGWKSFIPVYNILTLLKIIGRPRWWALFLIIPVVGFIIGAGIIIDLVKCYGRHKSRHHCLAIVFGIFYLPYLGYRSDVTYLGQLSDLPRTSNSAASRWIIAISLSLLTIVIFRWGLFEAYTIPAPSMSKTLIVGDHLFVSKLHYGARTPITPVQVPLTHQRIWKTGLPSYSSVVQLSPYRLPGFSSIKRNDVVVFNVPGIAENNFQEYNKDKWINYPTDLKTNYIKRCVAIPGDVIEVRSGQVHINGAIGENPSTLQFSYLITSSAPINANVMKENNIKDFGILRSNGSKFTSFAHTTPETAAALEKLPFISSVKKATKDQGNTEMNIFPDAGLFPWNGDFYGPLTVPKQGVTININKETLATYGKVIRLFDHNNPESVVISEDGKLSIDGNNLTEYTFNQDYYFMMGDNRHNSLDSRYWGFVPADHVVGKGFFIWMSLDPDETFLSKIRWSRLFNLIR